MPVIDPPWRLDPLQNLINVKWGTSGSRKYLKVPIVIERCATLGFQATLSARQATDWAGDPVINPSDPLQTTTQFRWVFASQNIDMTHWPAVSDFPNPPINDPTLGAITLSGLPGLPQTVSLSMVAAVRPSGGSNASADIFAPQAHWKPLGGRDSDVLVGTTAFQRGVTDMTIHMIGLAPTNAADPNVGVLTEGGYVAITPTPTLFTDAEDEERYPEHGGDLTISLGGLSTHYDGNDWVAVGAAHQPGRHFHSTSDFLPAEPGTIWVLFLKVGDPDIPLWL